MLLTFLNVGPSYVKMFFSRRFGVYIQYI